MTLWTLFLRPMHIPDMPLGVVFIVIVLAVLYIVEPKRPTGGTKW